MRFYRSLGTIAAITFDLDDTLYDNQPVMLRTEQASLDFMRRYHPNLSQFKADEYYRLRQMLLEDEPDIYHDVTEWRYQAVECAMRNAGLSPENARSGARATMDEFAVWRSRVDVPQETHDTLGALAGKWPLVAITNGNADPHLFGLGDYFRFVLRAGPDGRAKPYRDMYHRAAQKLGVVLWEILHVGDDLTTDVGGAIRGGVQACWINQRDGDVMQIDDSRLLPHLEISRLASLTSLI